MRIWHWLPWSTQISIYLVALLSCGTQLTYPSHQNVYAATLDESTAWLPLEIRPTDIAPTACPAGVACSETRETTPQPSGAAPAHPSQQAAFQPGYKYYLVDRLGLFDITHIQHGKDQMEEILREIHSGYVQLTFVTQRSLTTGKQIRITGFYRVRRNLPPEQLQQVALGIAMDFEHLIEKHQTPGSSYSLEDLPSDYIGYFLALHPQWSMETLLTRLDADQQPTGLSKINAHLYKSFQRNREFLPIPQIGGPHISWPRLLYMEPIGPWNGYWIRTIVLVTPDDRAWLQKWLDWGLKAYDVIS